MKSIAVIVRFRYLNRKGEGASSMWAPRFERHSRVVIKNAWGDGVRIVQYKAEALDPSLQNFLKRHAHPSNQEVFFVPGDITFMEGKGNVTAPPRTTAEIPSRTKEIFLNGIARRSNP